MPPDGAEPRISNLAGDGARRRAATRLDLGESVQSYLVFVLMRYLREGAWWRTYSRLDLLLAATSERPRRADALRDVGPLPADRGPIPETGRATTVSPTISATWVAAVLGVAERHGRLCHSIADSRALRGDGAACRCIAAPRRRVLLPIAWAEACEARARGH